MRPLRIAIVALMTFLSAVPSPFLLNLSALQVLAQTPDSRQTQADSLLKQGDAQLERKEFTSAVQSYQQALSLYQELKQTDLSAEATSGLAKASLLAGDYPQAIQLLQSVVNQARQRGFGKEPPLSNLGLAWFLSGNLPEAEKALREAIDSWESIRGLNGNDDIDKVTLFEQQAYTYRLLQKVLVAQKKTDAALELAERSRSRALVELLVQRLGTNSRSISPPTLNQIKQIAKTQNSTLVEYSVVGNEVRVLGNEPGDETDLFIWVIKPTGEIAFRQVNFKQLGINSLKDLVLKTREEGIGVRGRGIGITTTTRSQAEKSTMQSELQQLYQLLTQPIADLLPTDPNARVTFIPQGSLFLVPFVALQDSAGNYLIQSHTILTAPSIQVLDLTHAAKQRLPKTASSHHQLVVGNPTMPSLPAKSDRPAEELPSLPGAEQEAKAIAPLLNTTALIGSQATKAAVLQLLPKQRIIHLATHGLLDIDAKLDEFGEPLNSAVRTARQSNVQVTPGAVLVGENVIVGGASAEESLSAEKVVRVKIPGVIALAPSGSDNGFLTAEEILGLKLSADLVVLSACDTGRGRITGDGVIGLSRSLIAAGVPSVIVSLWSVPDAPTATLMTQFYQNLQLSSDKAQALRQAMLTTLKQHPDPRDWAAFTLIGEAE